MAERGSTVAVAAPAGAGGRGEEEEAILLGFWTRARDIFNNTKLSQPEVDALRDGGKRPAGSSSSSVAGEGEGEGSTAAAAVDNGSSGAATVAPALSLASQLSSSSSSSVVQKTLLAPLQQQQQQWQQQQQEQQQQRQRQQQQQHQHQEQQRRLTAEQKFSTAMQEEWLQLLEEEILLLRIERANEKVEKEKKKVLEEKAKKRAEDNDAAAANPQSGKTIQTLQAWYSKSMGPATSDAAAAAAAPASGSVLAKLVGTSSRASDAAAFDPDESALLIRVPALPRPASAGPEGRRAFGASPTSTGVVPLPWGTGSLGGAGKGRRPSPKPPTGMTAQWPPAGGGRVVVPGVDGGGDSGKEVFPQSPARLRRVIEAARPSVHGGGLALHEQQKQAETEGQWDHTPQHHYQNHQEQQQQQQPLTPPLPQPPALAALQQAAGSVAGAKRRQQHRRGATIGSSLDLERLTGLSPDLDAATASEGVQAAMAAAVAATSGGKRMARVWERMKKISQVSQQQQQQQQQQQEDDGAQQQQQTLIDTSVDESAIPQGQELVAQLLAGEIGGALRGQAWLAACIMVDADEVGANREKYYSLLQQPSACSREIERDINRTFPTHAMFKEEKGAGQNALFNVIKAYSVLDKEVGYCQGMAFIAATMLMNMGQEDAFCCLCFLMNQCGLRANFLPDMSKLQLCTYQLAQLLARRNADLHAYFEELEVKPVMYAADWFLTLFSRSMPHYLACRVLDIVLADKSTAIVFKLAMVLLQICQRQLMQCPEMEHAMTFLKTDLPNQLKRRSDKDLEELMAKAMRVDLPFESLLRLEAEYELLASEAAAAARDVQAAAFASEAAAASWERDRTGMETRLAMAAQASQAGVALCTTLERHVQRLRSRAGLNPTKRAMSAPVPPQLKARPQSQEPSSSSKPSEATSPWLSSAATLSSKSQASCSTTLDMGPGARVEDRETARNMGSAATRASLGGPASEAGRHKPPSLQAMSLSVVVDGEDGVGTAVSRTPGRWGSGLPSPSHAASDEFLRELAELPQDMVGERFVEWHEYVRVVQCGGATRALVRQVEELRVRQEELEVLLRDVETALHSSLLEEEQESRSTVGESVSLEDSRGVGADTAAEQWKAHNREAWEGDHVGKTGEPSLAPWEALGGGQEADVFVMLDVDASANVRDSET